MVERLKLAYDQQTEMKDDPMVSVSKLFAKVKYNRVEEGCTRVHELNIFEGEV